MATTLPAAGDRPLMPRRVALQVRSSDATLTRGLRRMLLSVLLTVVVLGGIMVIGLSKLTQQVAGWSHVETLDEQRELTATLVHRFEEAAPNVTGETLRSALRAIAEMVEQSHPQEDNQFRQTAHETLQRAFRQLDKATRNRDEVLALHTRLRAETAQLADTAEARVAQLSMQHEQNARQAYSAEIGLRVLSRNHKALTDLWMVATQMRRNLEAMPRNAAGSSPSGAAVPPDPGQLGDLCQPPQPGQRQGTGEGECPPEGLRLRAALAELQRAAPEQRADAIQAAVRAADALVRVAHGDHASHFAAIATGIDHLNALRREASDIQRQTTVLQQLVRNLAAIDGTFDQMSAATYGDRSATIGRMTALLEQLQASVSALPGRGEPGGETGASLQDKAAMLQSALPRFTRLVALKDQSFEDFETSMNDLAALISSQAQRIRNQAKTWVGFFASFAVVIVGLFLLATGAIYHAGRRLFVYPLAKVTGAIVALVRGRIDTPITIHQTAFGFDGLGRALEELRGAMLERSALASRNAEQTDLIKRNLETLEQTTREMQWLAMHDPLTGLGNRRAADTELARLTEARQANLSGDFCLIHVDVDRFKEINDTLGHEAGDFVLRRVAATLRKLAEPDGRCFRIGGDEFLIVFANGADPDAIEAFARHAIRDLSAPADYQGHACQTGASLGIAFGSDADHDAQTTLVNADIALYEAKRAGRGDYRLFSDTLRNSLRQRKSLSDKLLLAVENRHFVPFYQPQFHAADLTLRGIETLCRWNDPDSGWIAPARFLDIAEELHVMGRIDQFLFETASADLRRLHDRGLTIPRISFNVTAQRLVQSTLANDLRSATSQGTQVVVELLESMSLDDIPDAMRWSIDRLKDAGIGIEIDDFGSCRASIAGLMSVVPDAMKIDKSIILPIVESDQHLQLVRAIIHIGQTLGIEVVAEGVETQDHVRILTDLGCDVLQGFALARPMALPELEAFLLGGALSRRPRPA